MPFKSKAQEKLFFAKEHRGELPKGTAERWAHHTKNIKGLPEHVKKAFMLNYIKNSFHIDQEKSAGIREWLNQLLGKNKAAPEAAPAVVPDASELPTQKVDPSELPTMSNLPPVGEAPKVEPKPVEAASLGAKAPNAPAAETGMVGRTLARIGNPISNKAQEWIPALKEQILKMSPEWQARLPKLIGGGAIGAGALGAAGLYSVGKHMFGKKDKTKEASLGTPFMDGFLMVGMKRNLSGEQMADVLEKAATLKGKIGDEARTFIERAIADTK